MCGAGFSKLALFCEACICEKERVSESAYVRRGAFKTHAESLS